MCRVMPKSGGKPIGNFSVNLYRLVDLYDDSKSAPIRYVELSLVFDGEPAPPKTLVLLSQLSKTNWRELDYRATFISNITQAQVAHFLADSIYGKIKNLPVATV